MDRRDADVPPVNELPFGLPMFGVTLGVPSREVDLQVFRVLGSRRVPAFVVHDVLVHPEQFDLVGEPDVGAYVQAHGRLWGVRNSGAGITELFEVGPATRYAVRSSFSVDLVDDGGTTVATEDAQAISSIDAAAVRLLRAPLAIAFPGEPLSAILLRPYPGRTSTIGAERPFQRIFASDPMGTCDFLPGWIPA